jgi:predicted methyltransferase
MNPPARRRLSIWFNHPPPSQPVRINHTLARPSKPAVAIMRPQTRRPNSPLALRNVRP